MSRSSQSRSSQARSRQARSPRRLLGAAVGIAALGSALFGVSPVSAEATPVAPAPAVAPASPDRTAAARSVTVTAQSSASDIRALQLLLTANGVPTGVDGAYGPQTTTSVRTFQQRAGLGVDGIAGPDTLGALGPVLRQGDGNADAVKAVQTLLVKNAISIGSVDGVFGSGTANGVRTLQQRAGLGVDGVVGRDTWSYLFGPVVGGGSGGGGDCSAVNSGVPIEQTTVAAANIRVHTCLAPRVAQLVSDARAAGITLTANSSWRDPQEQIALRRQNCGPTQYDIYEKPSGECSPPTAIPGSSRHERGLAIDFANSGTQGTAVFQWLAANASRYGLSNLPSEPWHWSIDGR